jgi:hypothetical protein
MCQEQTYQFAANLAFLFLETRLFLCWNGQLQKARGRSVARKIVDFDGVRLCVRTAATNGHVVHPLDDT